MGRPGVTQEGKALWKTRERYGHRGDTGRSEPVAPGKDPTTHVKDDVHDYFAGEDIPTHSPDTSLSGGGVGSVEVTVVE